MSLPEVMLKSLEDKKLPKCLGKPRLKIFSERVPSTVTLVNSVRSSVSKVKPLSRFKTAVIRDTWIIGARTTYNGIKIFKYNDLIRYKAIYKNQLPIPLLAKVIQRIGSAEKIIHVFFMPHASYTGEVTEAVTAPKYIPATAKIQSETGLITYDSVYETYTIGVLDDRYKLVEEYPVDGVDNAELTIMYDFKVGNFIYPQPTPSGLSFQLEDPEFIQGFLMYNDKRYKTPGTDNVVRVGYRVTNNTGATIKLTHWGFPISVLYEDSRHVSQADMAVSISPITLKKGKSVAFTFDVALPDWAYGMIALAHALNVYKDGMYIYGGGPLWQFECFRLLLPG